MSAHPRRRVKSRIGCCESEGGLRRRAHYGLQNAGCDEWVCEYK